MATRTVELQLIDEFLAAVKGFPDDRIDKAIGYLSGWAIFGGRFPKVRVFGDRDGNLSGLYLKADGEMGYEIFGLRGEDGTYSFHS